MALKHSKQRDMIKDFLVSRKDHPTADVVYMNVRLQQPNISLGNPQAYFQIKALNY